MSDSSRDVALNVTANVDGSQLQGLSEDLRDVGVAGQGSATELERLGAELTEATAKSAEASRAENALAADVRAAASALAEKREALALSRATADAATKATDDYKAADQASKVAILEGVTALRQKREELERATASSRAAAGAEKNLQEQMRRAAAEATESAHKQAEAHAEAREALKGLNETLNKFSELATVVVGGSVLGELVGKLSETTDEFKTLQSQVRRATEEGGDFTTAMEGIFAGAQRTGTEVAVFGKLFSELTEAGRKFNLTQAQALSLTEEVAQAAVLTGKGTEAASASMESFARSLASGRLEAHQLHKVLEDSPRLARALADGLGVSIIELKKLAETGSLSVQTVLQALQGQAATVREEFDKLQPTIARATQNLETAFTKYIGEADEAKGASAELAGAIDLVSKNLSTVIKVLVDAGEAAVAFKAVKVASTFLEIGTAARGAAAGVAEYEAAQLAAGRGGAAAGGGIGKFAQAIGGVKIAALVAIVTNIKDIGEAIGNQFGAWSKWGKVMRDAEDHQKAQEAATRATADAVAAYDQKMRLAADAALDLGVESKALIGKFDEARTSGETVASALDKVKAAMNLSDISGIKTAISALDALAVRGEITSNDVRDSLAGALQTADLGKFETAAQTAFDAGEIGARRFATAVDAVDNESLRRAGISMVELTTGYSEGFAKAANDTDMLVRAFDRLKATGPETQIALAKSLDITLSAATSEKAINGVVERYEALGKAGRLSSEQVADGLEKARNKLDALLPGVNDLNEALHNFGLKSKEELQSTADKLSASWDQIKNSTTVAIDDQVKAFEAYAAAATAANKGVETSEIRLQREILRTRQIAAGDTNLNGTPLTPGGNGTGNGGGGGGGDGRGIGPGNRPKTAEDIGLNPAEDQRGKGPAVIGPNQDVHSTLNAGNDTSGKAENTVPIDLAYKVFTHDTAGMSIDDLQKAHEQAMRAKAYIDGMEKLSAGVVEPKAISDAMGMVTATQVALQAAKDRQTVQAHETAASQQRASAAQNPQPTQTIRHEIVTQDRTHRVDVANPQSSDNLTAFLKSLATAKGTAQ